MGECSTTAAYTLIGMAEKFQDFFYGVAKDITFKYKDLNGNIQTKTVPNVEKVKEELMAASITTSDLNNALTNYYTRTGVDDLLVALKNTISSERATELNNYYNKTEVTGLLTTLESNVMDSSKSYIDDISYLMTKAEFESNCEVNKENVMGSGQYSQSNNFYDLFVDDKYAANYMFHNIGYSGKYANKIVPNQLLFPLDEGTYEHRCYNQMFNIDGRNIFLFGTGVGYQISAPSKNNYGIDFPKINMPTVIKDSTNIPLLKAGDKAILEYSDRELWNINFSQRNSADGKATIIDNGNGSFTYNTNGETGSRAWYFIDYANKFEAISNVTYVLTFNYDNLAYTDRIHIDLTGYRNIYIKDGLVTVIFTTPDNRGNHNNSNIYGSINLSDNNNGDITFSNFSLKQFHDPKKLDIVLGVVKDTHIGDIYTQSNNFICIPDNSVTETDFVFLEVWSEDISEKGVVYPYGNIQFSGVNYYNSVLDKHTFTGSDTYSLYGNYQNPGDLVGLSYIWNNLTYDDKVKFASYPLNNIYLDKDKIMQVRYRIRIIKGNFNYYEGFTDYFRFGKYYVVPKGSRTSIPTDLEQIPYSNKGLYGTTGTWIRETPREVKGLFYFGYPQHYKTNYHQYALPLLSVSRRNPGIYHPKYNTNGCSKIYYNNTHNYFYEVPEAIINSLADCFDPGKIAVYNPTDNSSGSLQDTNNGTLDSTTYFVTGTLESTISGRFD